jgi:orotate phosphoribosyltransferase
VVKPSDLLDARRGHFALESGHHGDLWLDLELLFARPRRVAPFAAELARRLPPVDAVCGPLLGGALVAQMVAAELDAELAWSERAEAGYRIPEPLRRRLSGARVAVVDDAINAGSATRATLADLRECGARPVALGALIVLGEGAHALAAAEGLACERVEALPNRLWDPAECPLCAASVPLSAR